MTLLADFALFDVPAPEQCKQLSRHRAGDHSLCDPESPRHGTCSECGKTVQVTYSSAPPERRRCRDCQQARPRHKPPGDPRACALPGCDVIYTPTHTEQRFCSVPCANKSGRGITTGSRTARPCEICGSQFKAKGGGTPGVAQRTCSRACGVELRRRERGTAGRERTHWPSTRVYIRPCEHCGELFVGRCKASRFCSRRCNDTAYNWRRSGGPPSWSCTCGTQIPPGRKKCDACLREARRQQRRQRKRKSVVAEPYTLAEIAARDRYRCGYCRKRVAMTKTVPHPKAPTIDHIVPWSVSKDDTRANVQLAHFECNWRAGTGGTKQLAMIG